MKKKALMLSVERSLSTADDGCLNINDVFFRKSDGRRFEWRKKYPSFLAERGSFIQEEIGSSLPDYNMNESLSFNMRPFIACLR